MGLTIENKISLGDVLDKLAKENIDLSDMAILYYNNKENIFYFCGIKKEANECFIPLNEIEDELVLKYREIKPIKVLNPKVKKVKKSTGKERSKERNIGEAIKKVIQWRQLYAEFKAKDEKSNAKLLEKAAKIVGIPKKTLEDYMLQIRVGSKYGFDINILSSAKIRTLLTFNNMKNSNNNKK